MCSKDSATTDYVSKDVKRSQNNVHDKQEEIETTREGRDPKQMINYVYSNIFGDI